MADEAGGSNSTRQHIAASELPGRDLCLQKSGQIVLVKKKAVQWIVEATAFLV